MKKFLLFLFLSFALSISTFATNSASADSKVTIITPISVSVTGELNFGTIIKGTNVVTLNTSGTIRTATITSNLVTGIQPTLPTFTVTGDGTQTYAVTVPPSPVTISDLNDSNNTMTINNFKTSLGDANTGTLVSGTQTFTVGADLTVGETQAAGSYKGTFPITVAYN